MKGGSSSSESSFHDKREIQIGAVPTAEFEMIGGIEMHSASMKRNGARRLL